MATWNQLKKLPVEEIEKAISKAISEISSADYGCTINNISFESMSGFKADIDIYLSLKKETKS